MCVVPEVPNAFSATRATPAASLPVIRIILVPSLPLVVTVTILPEEKTPSAIVDKPSPPGCAAATTVAAPAPSESTEEA